MEIRALIGVVTAVFGTLLLLLPKGLFVPEGIGYVKSMRIMMTVLGLVFIGYGAYSLAML